MREILFRGKDEDTKEWIIGQLDAETLGIRKNGYRYYHAVIPETVGQFTGLTDTNGKRIFEGDILSFTLFGWNYSEKQLCGVVTFEQGEYKIFCDWGIDSDKYSLSGIIEIDDCAEIIGNKHDNPELLKTGGKGSK